MYELQWIQLNSVVVIQFKNIILIREGKLINWTELEYNLSISGLLDSI